MSEIAEILNLAESRFLSEYQKDCNATQAYLRAFPHVTYDSAKVQGSLVINRPHVQAALVEIKENTLRNHKVSKNSLTDKALKLIDKAEAKDKYGPAIQGLEFVAKVNGMFENQEDDQTKYSTFIMNIVQNNINLQNKDISQAKVIAECVNRTDSLNSGEIEQKLADSGENAAEISENE
jgi:phage terminase small subunit